MMNTPDNALFWDAVRDLIASPLAGDLPGDGRAYARAHNFMFDAHAAGEREQEYYQSLDLKNGSSQSLREGHARYIGERVRAVQIPPTFLPSNAKAHITPPQGDPYLIRVECIDGLLNRLMVWLGEKSLEAAFRLFVTRLNEYQSGKPGQPEHNQAEAFLEDWLDDWSTERDSRPTFAAFENDVAQSISAGKWAESLRTRLGLAHLEPSNGTSVYVALMRYPVAEVMTAFGHMSGASSAFAVPTVLDGDIYEYFFPAPIEPNGEKAGCGWAMPLEPVVDTGQLVAEFLHVKLDYRLKHLHKLGVLKTSIPSHTVRKLRNAHRDAVCIEMGIDHFGEEIPELAES